MSENEAALRATTREPPGGHAALRSGTLALTIACHPDAVRVGQRCRLTALLSGAAVPLSRVEPGFGHPAQAATDPIADPFVSRRPAMLAPTAEGGVRICPGGAALTVDGRPAGGEVAVPASAIARGVVLGLAGRVVLVLHHLGPQGPPGPDLGMIGDSDAMCRLRREVSQVADLDVPVLLLGETGSGKELVARAIHQLSRRRGPWIAINMAAIPSGTAASELFGHVRGAYTGALADYDGAFVRAHGGTLFLDEVADTSDPVQPLLLRTLETAEVQPLGSPRIRKVDVRLVAATDADIRGAVDSGSFRAPLLHRLAGYEIHVPPLRERRDDVGRLLVAFLRDELRRTGELHRLDREPEQHPWLPADLVARLVLHGWPGNVRQLRNVARQLVIASRGLPALVTSSVVERLLDESWAAAKGGPATPRRPAGVSQEELIEALRNHGWRPGAAAAALGIARSSLYRLIDACPSIRKASEIGREELERAVAAQGGDADAVAAALEVSPRGLKLRMRELES